jgi:hypothetical protein
MMTPANSNTRGGASINKSEPESFTLIQILDALSAIFFVIGSLASHSNSLRRTSATHRFLSMIESAAHA